MGWLQRADVAAATRWRVAMLYLLLALVAVLPLLLAPLPLLIDLPSHLSRYHIERSLGGSTALQRNFTFHWRYVPNLGVDLMVAGLDRLMGVELATRLVVAATPAIAAAGMAAISRVVHGRVTFAAIMAMALAYAFPFTFGFVNAWLACAAAMLAFAVWLWLDRSRRAGWRLALTLGAAPVLLTLHIVGYGAFGLMVAGAAISSAFTSSMPLRRVILNLVARTLPLVWSLPFLLLWRTGDGATINHWFDWRLELSWLTMLLRDRWLPVDGASIALLYAVALLPCILATRFRYQAVVLMPALLLWTAALLMPNRMMGSEFAAVRLLPIALALTLLAVEERGPPRALLTSAAIAFVAVRLIVVATTLTNAAAGGQRILAALPHLPRGSRVAAVGIVDCPRRWAPARFNHLASYATVRRDVFVNGQFAAIEGQLLGLTSSDLAIINDVPTAAALEPCPRLAQSVPLSTLVGSPPMHGTEYLWIFRTGDAALPSLVGRRPMWSDQVSAIYTMDARRR